MDLVIRISRDDLLAALLSNPATLDLTASSKSAPKPAKAVKAPKPAPVEADFDETEEDEEPVKPAKAVKVAKPKAKPAPVEEDEDESEEIEEDAEAEEVEEGEEESESDEDEFISGEELTKLKKALNAHKSANGGKPKKTLEILRKFAPGGSEKVKPDVLPKLLKALKV